jgi:hypothetical protein
MPSITVEKYKALVKYIMDNFKALETELSAYRMVLLATKILDPNQGQLLEQALQAALKSPALANQMRDKDDVALETFLKQVDEASAGESLLRWIQEWKPQGPIN